MTGFSRPQLSTDISCKQRIHIFCCFMIKYLQKSWWVCVTTTPKQKCINVENVGSIKILINMFMFIVRYFSNYYGSELKTVKFSEKNLVILSSCLYLSKTLPFWRCCDVTEHHSEGLMNKIHHCSELLWRSTNSRLQSPAAAERDVLILRQWLPFWSLELIH